MMFRIAVAAAFLMTASFAQARTVNVCTSIKLPAPGKCTYLTVRGFKVRVCNK